MRDEREGWEILLHENVLWTEGRKDGLYPRFLMLGPFLSKLFAIDRNVTRDLIASHLSSDLRHVIDQVTS